MAANEYYGQSTDRYNNYNNHHNNQYEPSIAPSANPPPSYTSQPPRHQANSGTTSPFDTVFDDHVYPTQSRPTLNTMASSQQSFAQDTRYHGTVPEDTSPVAADDIPLRHHGKQTGFMTESNDHVYDAEPATRTRGAKKGRFGYGELGMMRSGTKKIPILVYVLSVIQIAVFIAELVKAAQLTGSPIQTQPTFNPLIGPSSQILINMGARYDPCMKNVDGVQNYVVPDGITVDQSGFDFACPNATSTDSACSLSELCGFGGVPNPEWLGEDGLDQKPEPNQWFRFITPIFLHAGFIHIGFNLLLQLTMGKEIEMAIGSIRFFFVYFAAGIFGFILGGNYAAAGIASTGCSGSLFGIIALTLLDLLYSWSDRLHPKRELFFIVLEVLVSFVLGLLPGLDNFSHIGGFLTGLLLGIIVLHSPNALRRRVGEDHFGGASYSTVQGAGTGITSVAFPAFYRNPVGFFKGRKPLWWAWWLLRASFLIVVIVLFIVLINNFYSNQNTCSWCKYLSCLVSRYLLVNVYQLSGLLMVS
ncbi:rhomboid-domain-containing protein [Xylariaceae sp. FL1272]|nr:rhomboid-domain-containing protein [Xylariaceae sp. FL1272]